MADIDYTKMTDEEVQNDLGILKGGKPQVCGVVADYLFTGDPQTGISTIVKGLTDFIQMTIGDENAEVNIGGRNQGSKPVYTASITSYSASNDEIADALKSADDGEYELIGVSVSDDPEYEEDVKK